MNEPITIRRSTEKDRVAMLDLAALDSRPAPEGDAMLAYVGSELRAAVTLTRGGPALADPFHHTADIVELLRIRATQERQERQRVRGPRRLAALRPRAA